MTAHTDALIQNVMRSSKPFQGFEELARALESCRSSDWRCPGGTVDVDGSRGEQDGDSTFGISGRLKGVLGRFYLMRLPGLLVCRAVTGCQHAHPEARTRMIGVRGGAKISSH